MLACCERFRDWGHFLVGGARGRPAPEWMRRSGLRWLFRFAEEAGRLWRRYLPGGSR